MKKSILLFIYLSISTLLFSQDILLKQLGTKDSVNSNSLKYLKNSSEIDYCDYIDCKIFAQDLNQQYLGLIITNQYDSESIINEYGNYGNSYSTTSIRNQYSTYGSQYSNYSAYNSYANKPPIVYKYNNISGLWEIAAYLTKNTFLSTGIYPKLDPDILISTLENGCSEPVPGYPDLIVSELSILESGYGINDSVTLSFTVLNNSIYNITNLFNIDILQDTVYLGGFYLNSLTALGYASGELKFKIKSPIHLLSVVLDIENYVVESLENNNIRGIYSIASLPDMQIDDLQLLYANDSISVNYKIKNTGLISIVDTFSITIKNNQETFDFKCDDDIQAGSAINLLNKIPVSVDTNNISITIDSYNNIFELNDSTNNYAFGQIIVEINTPPIFNSEPITRAVEDSAYIYDIICSDQDGDNLTILAQTKPEWLAFFDIGDGTAVLQGQPKNENVGNQNILLIVHDGKDSTEQSFTLNVINVNDTPRFVSEPILIATENVEYSYNIVAEDVDNDILNITSLNLPDWLTILDNKGGTAILSGIPNASHSGENNIQLIVDDGVLENYQNFNINVELVNKIQNLSNRDFKIYPLPAKNIFTIELNTLTSQTALINLYNISGQLLFSEKYLIIDNKIPVFVPSLESSVYILEINIDSDNYRCKISIE